MTPASLILSLSIFSYLSKIHDWWKYIEIWIHLLKWKHHASVVIMLHSQDEADKLLHEMGGLMVFGDFVKTGRYTNKRPLKQCKQCWKYDQYQQTCKQENPICQLCSGSHHEQSHKCKQCDKCDCQHMPLKCINCGEAHLSNYSQCNARCAQLHQTYCWIHEYGLWAAREYIKGKIWVAMRILKLCRFHHLWKIGHSIILISKFWPVPALDEPHKNQPWGLISLQHGWMSTMLQVWLGLKSNFIVDIYETMDLLLFRVFFWLLAFNGCLWLLVCYSSSSLSFVNLHI